ncbi:beta-ketoacyl synthase N-terminal-like domain-containing protein [Streptomyces sp. NPDC002506]|uniref:beta-ketoacyl synthase N-terminal-like domain-containing protein n=1 Tax=Streptomyces sp. NPDC002506 TaxID=3154536 RepID=UPI00332EE4F5
MEWNDSASSGGTSVTGGEPPSGTVLRDPVVVLVSAGDRGRLTRSARSLREYLDRVAREGPASGVLAVDVAWTTQTGRTPLRHRLAVVCTGLDDAVAALGAYLAGLPDPRVHTGSANPATEAADPRQPSTAAEAAALWAGGTDLPWHLYWRQRPARVSLPAYPFAEEDPPTGSGAGTATEVAPEPERAPEPADAAARVAEVEEYLLGRYTEVSGIPLEDLDAHVSFDQYGLTSFQINLLNADLERDWGVTRRTLFFECRHLHEVAERLVRRHDARRKAASDPAASAVAQLPAPAPAPTPAPRPAAVPAGNGAIAVIGVAGRYPRSPDLDTFWANLVGGRDCVSTLPEERHRPGWPVERMVGGFLDDVDRFDPLLFGITPRDAALMDPQERLFTQSCWEALEDAGLTRERLREEHGSRVGVYIGSMYSDYAFFGVEETLRGNPSYAGGAIGNIANRVSYLMDLHGPSLAVDTMCSSSMTALHLAVRSLRSGDCEVAIAGAVNLSLHPNKFIQQNKMSLTSSSLRCRSFGAGGDGFVPAEGVGSLVLKPLDRALADGDRVRAVIRGTAVVHAGRTNGYIVPSPVAQSEVVRDALADAGLRPRDIDYVEAHGAGTALGDPVEIEGLNRVFDTPDRAVGSLPIGSVKSTIGHVEAAAGIAAFTRTLLQLEHATLAPSLHAEELNPNVDWAATPFQVQREAAPWPAALGPDGLPRPRRAGISSFGAGGTIAHVVLEEYPAARAPERPSPSACSPQLIVLSAYDEQRLRTVADRLAARLRQGSEQLALADVAWTLQQGREPLKERTALVATDVADLRGRLERFAAGDDTGVLRGRAPAQGRVRPARADGAEGLWDTGRHWVNGGQVDWPALHRTSDAAGARPCVVSLPTYPFARTRCWIPETVAAVAPGSVPAPASDAAVPAPAVPVPAPAVSVPAPGAPADDAQLLHREWMPTGQASAATGPSGTVVVCLHTEATRPLAEELARTASPGSLLLVREGPGTGELGYSDDAGADAVTEKALARHPVIAGWIDLADLGGPAATFADGWTARLLLIRRLIGARPGVPVRGVHVVRGLQDLEVSEPDPAGARVAGFLRMLGAEYPRVDTTVIDTDLPISDPAALAESIWGEWHERGAQAEVCHRHGLRYEPVLRPTLGHYAPLAPDRAKAYVVTGGTRGIGAKVAGLLADRGARRIALLGGRPLPPRDRWREPGALDARAAETVELVERLEGRGVHVLVHTGPLTDEPAIDGFLRQVRTELGPIGGVVHCAGGHGTGRPAFVGKDSAAIRATFAPKIDGLETLAALCAADRPDFFLVFSSACSLVPRLAVGVSDYAAANAAMDFFVAHQVREGRDWFRSVAWPMWTESGAARGKDNVCAPAGLAALGDSEGLRILERAVALPWGGTVLPARPLSGALDVDALIRAKSLPAPEASVVAEPAAVPRPAAAPEPEVGAAPPAAGAGHAWLTPLVASVLGTPEAELDVQADFADLGVESVMLGELLESVEEAVGRRLQPALLLEHSSVEQLAAYCATLGLPPAPAVAAAESGPTRTAAQAPDPVRAPADAPAPVRAREPGRGAVAVIGMAGRFPGAPDVATYWQNLLDERCSVTEVPPGRWDVDEVYRPAFEPGYSTGKWGGFLEGLEMFDPDPFQLGDAEATALDPGIRLFLETTADCLADAGYTREELWGRDVAVYVGGRISDYARRAPLRPEVLQSDQNFLTAQVAHRFDFRGPNMVVDSACSSSLVAVQLACRALQAGDAELALVGGVELLLDERPYLEFSVARAISPTGRCRSFDEAADGFVPGEGCGGVLLKPLEAALADGDRIHAVIESIAVNNDGHTMGTTTPSPAAQSDVVRRALAAAGRQAREIGLVEAHGTATRIGDPLELQALTEVFRESSPDQGFCAIGSVKSNVGHLLCAAGVAGLIKVALCLRHGRIPATLFCDNPNPRFDFAHSPFVPTTRTRDWPVEASARVAGLSSFGLGGTNAHLIASALDPASRPAGVPVRGPLPAPVYRRRRLWLDPPARSAVSPSAPPAPRPLGNVTRAAILDLRFTTGAPAGHHNGGAPLAGQHR